MILIIMVIIKYDFFFIPKKAENYKNLNMSLQLKLEFEIFFL